MGPFYTITKLAFIANHLCDAAATFLVSPSATKLQELELSAIMTVWIVWVILNLSQMYQGTPLLV